MTTPNRPQEVLRSKLPAAVFVLWLLGFAFAVAARADLVELTNGDHYSGTVLSVNLTNIALRSEVQGLINLPRSKVASIAFGQARLPGGVAQTTVVPLPRAAKVQSSAGPTNQPSSKMVGQVQDQLLGGADPQAVAKYNQMAQSLLSGNLNMADLRKEAQRTLQAVEQAKQEFGPEMDDILDNYLNVLRQFLQQPTQ